MRIPKPLVVISLTLSCLMAWPFQSTALVKSYGQNSQTGAIKGTPPAWVARSNENAQVLLKVIARFNPESAGQFGVEGLDEQVVDWKPGVIERSNQATREAAKTLKERLASEKDESVRQDLEILLSSAESNV